MRFFLFTLFLFNLLAVKDENGPKRIMVGVHQATQLSGWRPAG